MANGYNPYGVASTQQNLLETLLGSEQAQKTGALALGEHKGEMSEEFQKEMIAAQKEQERLLQQQRKKKGLGGLLETVAPMLGLIPGVGTVGGAVLGGLSGMYGASKQSKHAQEQIAKARAAMLDKGKWGGTFLGKDARTVTAESESMLDEMLSKTKLSTGDLLKTGLAEGMKGYAMGEIGEGIGEAFSSSPIEAKMLDAPKDFKIGEHTFKGMETIDWDALNMLESEQGGFLKKLFSGLGETDLTKLFESGTGTGNAFQNLLMLLSQATGDE